MSASRLLENEIRTALAQPWFVTQRKCVRLIRSAPRPDAFQSSDAMLADFFNSLLMQARQLQGVKRRAEGRFLPWTVS